MQHDCYFVKMAYSQRTAQYLLHGKIILSINKYAIMNLWDYYKWEAKKYGHGVNYALKITDATSTVDCKKS